VGKRSPILGYNHNVRYRGLVFHVQTEDSGIASPHLFTHLFHYGVIVSTRKLVYDAGAAEDVIKSLMQAQHKATLKDLRRGHFDDKIDSYLGGTPGLLPRGAGEAAARPREDELPPSQGTVEDVAIGGPTQQVEPMFDEPSAPEILIFESTPPPSQPSIPLVPPVRPPAELPPAPATARPMPMLVDTTLRTAAPIFDPSDIEIDVELPLTLDDSSDTIAFPRRLIRDTAPQAPFTDQTRPTLDVRFDDHTKPTLGRLDERVAVVRAGSPASIAGGARVLPRGIDKRSVVAGGGDPDGFAGGAGVLPREIDEQSAVVREEHDGATGRSGSTRAASVSDGVPGPIRPSTPAISDSRRLGDRPSGPVVSAGSSDSRRLGDRPSGPATSAGASDSRRLGDRPSSPAIPPLPSDSRRLGDRPSTINAATLPPARPIPRPTSRPPLTPPVVSRPVTADDRRSVVAERGDPDGTAGGAGVLAGGIDRSHREPDATLASSPAPPATDLPTGERSGQYAQHKKAIPRAPTDGFRSERSGGVPVPAGLGRPPRMGTSPVVASPSPASSATAPSPASMSREPSPPTAGQTGPAQARTPTPARISPPGSVGSRSGGTSGGVVMTRPAVIVGAPSKSMGTVPRIRKAREDEGRGFGQGLISEKSLDEVILAYLSEDADEK
jgi:hypothetical protein